MAYLIGAGVALAVVIFAKFAGFDRDRVFYPTVLIVVASYYVLFAAMGANGRTLIIEVAFSLAFVVAAVVGFKLDMRYVAAGLVGHGVFDAIRSKYTFNPSVPEWWPGFCLACDILMGTWLFIVARKRKVAGGSAAS